MIVLWQQRRKEEEGGDKKKGNSESRKTQKGRLGHEGEVKKTFSKKKEFIKDYLAPSFC